MSSNDSPHHHHPHHNKTTQNVFDKLSSKFSAIKEDLTEAVKERSRSFSSDRHSSMSSTSSLANVNSSGFLSNDDAQPMINHRKKSLKTSGMYVFLLIFSVCRTRFSILIKRNS